jgi:hypothetical protein
MVNDMKLTMMKLTRSGTRWRIEMTGTQANAKPVGFTFAREADEGLASAAVRLEDLLRQLYEGELKPLNLVKLTLA